MDRAFLEALGVGGGAVESILDAFAAEDAQLREELSAAQAQVNDLTAQISARDYEDVMAREIKGREVRFSSKGAERAFMDALRAQGLPCKDGALEGFDDFLAAQRAADPGAFWSERPSFVRPVGTGAPPARGTRAAELAAQYHQNRYGMKESD